VHDPVVGPVKFDSFNAVTVCLHSASDLTIPSSEKAGAQRGAKPANEHARLA
jgi:hypothetical protein